MNWIIYWIESPQLFFDLIIVLNKFWLTNIESNIELNPFLPKFKLWFELFWVSIMAKLLSQNYNQVTWIRVDITAYWVVPPLKTTQPEHFPDSWILRLFISICSTFFYIFSCFCWSWSCGRVSLECEWLEGILARTRCPPLILLMKSQISVTHSRRLHTGIAPHGTSHKLCTFYFHPSKRHIALCSLVLFLSS